MVCIITIVFAIIAAVQVKTTVRKKLYPELVLSMILLAVSLVYSYGEVLEWNLPGPTKFLTYIYDPVSHYVFKVLLK